MTEEQMLQLFSDIKSPTLIIIAKEGLYNDDLSLPSVKPRIDKITAPKSLIILEGDHHLHLTKASKVAKQILHFLKSPAIPPTAKL